MRNSTSTLLSLVFMLLCQLGVQAQINQNIGTICDLIIPTIACGSTISGNNNLEPNRLTEYECFINKPELYAGEKVYRLEIKEYTEVQLDMKILDKWVDLDLFLIKDVCDPKAPYSKVLKKDCLAQAYTNPDNHKEKRIVARLEAGTYLLIIDGPSKYDRGRFYLTVECGFHDLCNKAIAVKCGDKLSNQSTINGRNDVWRYTCGSGVYEAEGNDQVYKIKLDKPGRLFVEMNVLSAGQDMQLTLIKGEICAEPLSTINFVEPRFCLGKSPEFGNQTLRRTLLEDLPAGTYYIAVDARMAMTQANYNISFNYDPVTCNLNVSPNVLDFTDKGGEQTLTISATRPWSTAPTQSWMDLSTPYGNSAGTTQVKVYRKDEPGNRQEILTFTCGSESQTVIVKQVGGCNKPDAAFSVSKNKNQVIVAARAQDSARYAWDFGNGQTSTAALDTIDLPTGPYRICLTVTSKCGTASTCQLVKVLGFAPNSELSVIEQTALAQPRIFPNPSQGEAYLAYETQQAGAALIQVYDLNGRELSKTISVQLDKGMNQFKLPVDHLQKGIYLLRMTLPNLSWSGKLVLE